jgi:hypothetical protein
MTDGRDLTGAHQGATTVRPHPKFGRNRGDVEEVGSRLHYVGSRFQATMKTIAPDSFLLETIASDFGLATAGQLAALAMRAREARERNEDVELACRSLARYLGLAARNEVPANKETRSTGIVSGQRATGGTEGERAHAAAISERIALVANADNSVLAFREAHGLPREGLSKKSALAFLRSPLLAHATTDDLAPWGISAVSHEATVIRRGTVKLGERTMERVVIRVSWRGDGKMHNRRLTYGWPPETGDDGFIEFPGMHGTEACPVRWPSVLDTLRREAKALSERAPFSTLRMSRVNPSAACTWLILTGKALPIAPIFVGVEVPGTVDSISVHALSRVASPESVAQAYAQAQRRTLGHRKGRAISPRSIELVLFVEREAGSPVVEFPDEFAARLRSKWNKRHASRKAWQFASTGVLVNTYRRTVGAFFPYPSDHAEWALAHLEAERLIRTGQAEKFIRMMRRRKGASKARLKTAEV